MVTDSLLVMRTDLYPFSRPKSKSETTRFLFPLCCTLTAHFSRKESQFDLYTVSIVTNIVCYIVYDIVCIYLDIAYDICYIVHDIVHDIVYDTGCSMESDSVLAVGCLNNDRSVLAKSYAWRPLALIPILKGSACAETNDD
jgi:hypothetical protein